MSAQLIGGIAGAAIGSMFGMPMLGFAIGSTLGAVLGAEGTEGPRLEDRSVQLSSLGAPIAVSFGTWRHTGNVIWPKDFQMDERSETESAKGGPENTTYSYTATFAVLLCKGPKSGIGRIWMNKKLVLDQDGMRDPCISGMRFMLGGEDQEPDPLMVARDGSAPAYRDSVLVIFEDLDCSDFGNRPPVVEAEVFSIAETANPGEARVSYDGDSAPLESLIGVALVDPETGNVWTTTSAGGFSSTVETVVTDELAQVQLTAISTPVASNAIESIIYVPAGATGREVWVMGWAVVGGALHDIAVIYNADSASHVITVDLGNRGTGHQQEAAFNPVTQKVMTLGQFGGGRVVDPATRAVESAFTVPATDSETMEWAIVTTDYLAVFHWGSLRKLTLINLADYTVHAVIDDPYTDLPYTGQVTYDPERERLIQASVAGSSAMHYNVIDLATGTVSQYTLIPAADAEDEINLSIAAVVYCPYNDRYIFGAGNQGGTRTTLYLVNPDTFATENTWAYEPYDAGEPDLLHSPLLIPKDDPNYILAIDTDSVKRLYLGGTSVGGPVTLASIVTAICTGEPAGLEDADIDVTELTDFVDGYCVQQQMPRVAALTPLTLAYFFDGVGSEHILKFPKRGQSPVVTIPKADRAAHEAGSDTPMDIKITRGAELERPYRVDVNYLTAARDYQVANQYESRITRNANQMATIDLPLVLADSKAKSVAMVNLYSAWLRTTFSFATDNSYAKYEPTDVFMIETDDATYIVLATSRSDQGNGVINWEGKIEDAAVYDQEGIVPADDFPPQTVRDPGDTILYLLDMPILRDQDNDAGFYVAMAGTTEGWRGAQLFKSVDGGSTYDPVLSATNAAAIGTAQSVLGDFTVGNIFDEGNSVTIVLDSGGPLISATTDQVLNGANTAVIGAPGRWEVINYREASLLAPDTYQLSGLLRGRRGTEWATGLHEAGDAFVLARVQTWQRTGANAAEIGVARLYKAPPFRTKLSEAEEQAFTNSAIGLKPYSPVELRAHRSGADLVIEWDRRSRIGYGTLHAIVPIGETTESYQIQIMDGSSVKRALTSSTETVTYTAADQTADWGSTTGPYVVRVAQVSATVGAGYTQEESLA